MPHLEGTSETLVIAHLEDTLGDVMVTLIGARAARESPTCTISIINLEVDEKTRKNSLKIFFGARKVKSSSQSEKLV